VANAASLFFKWSTLGTVAPIQSNICFNVPEETCSLWMLLILDCIDFSKTAHALAFLMSPSSCSLRRLMSFSSFWIKFWRMNSSVKS
jgi:hypothetical protein